MSAKMRQFLSSERLYNDKAVIIMNSDCIALRMLLIIHSLYPSGVAGW